MWGKGEFTCGEYFLGSIIGTRNAHWHVYKIAASPKNYVTFCNNYFPFICGSQLLFGSLDARRPYFGRCGLTSEVESASRWLVTVVVLKNNVKMMRFRDLRGGTAALFCSLGTMLRHLALLLSSHVIMCWEICSYFKINLLWLRRTKHPKSRLNAESCSRCKKETWLSKNISENAPNFTSQQ
jgi:hypothetical protein